MPVASWGDVDWRGVDDYGLRHLAIHVYAAGTTHGDELYDLSCEPFMWEKYRRSLSHRSFADDVTLMIRMAESAEPPDIVHLTGGCLLFSRLSHVASTTTASTETTSTRSAAGPT